jgi:hypothetical protein
MAFWNRNKNPNGLRLIKTGRDIDSINQAAKNGYRPLVKKVEPSPEIRSKYAVIQNKHTGKIALEGDYRSGSFIEGSSTYEFETVIGWTFYYPHNFKSPFAAYLIPSDIIIGERVFVEDLIEDFIGASWNQGDKYRLDSCEAIWNGTDLEIQYDPQINRSHLIG